MLKKIKKFYFPIKNKYLIYLFNIFLIILGVSILLYNYSDGHFFDYYKLSKEYGKIAWYLLIYTIFSSLLFKLFPKINITKQIFILRKFAGIGVFYFAFLHLLFYLLHISFNIESFLILIKNNYISFISGIIAFILLIPLFITSAKNIKKIMSGKSWFLLHKLTHIVFIFVIIHIFFLKKDIFILFLFSIYILGYSYLFWKSKLR